MAEFDGIRARMYKDALKDYPTARKGDLALMRKYFVPEEHEVVLEVGAGNGMFSGDLADSVKRLYVADPSAEQLAGVDELGRSNITIINKPAEEIDLPNESVDGIWSFGAVHHMTDKTKAFNSLSRILRAGSRLVFGDVFQGSALARHFDEQVAKYSVTGHNVTFLTRESISKLCTEAGFDQPRLAEFNASWKFKDKESIGDFLYKLHAMTKATPEECLRGAEEILGIDERDGSYYLNWPMTMVVTAKLI